MPRKLTVECTCDRCGRVWYENYTEGEEPPPTTKLEAKLSWPLVLKEEQTLVVKFDVLCSNCSDTLHSYVKKLGELKHRSPSKLKAKKEPDERSNSSKKVKPPARPSPGGTSPARST